MSNTALGTIDKGGDGKLLLLAMVSKKLGEELSPTDYDFQDPSPPLDDSFDRNTMIRMYPLAESGGYGPKIIYYNRIDIAELGTVSIDIDNYVMVSDTLDAINEKYGIYLTANDIIDEELPAPDATGKVYFDIKINENKSLVFYNKTSAQLEQPITKPPFIPDLTLFSSMGTYIGDIVGGIKTYTQTPRVISCNIANNKYKSFDIEAADSFSKITRLSNTGYFERELKLITRLHPSENSYRKEFPFLAVWKRNGISYGVSEDGQIYRTTTDHSMWYADRVIYQPGTEPGKLIIAVRDNNYIVVLGGTGDVEETTFGTQINCTLIHYSADYGETWTTSINTTPFTINTGMSFVLGGTKLYIWDRVSKIKKVEYITKQLTETTIDITNDNYRLPSTFIQPTDYGVLSGFSLAVEPISGKPALYGYSCTTNSLLRIHDDGTGTYTISAVYVDKIIRQGPVHTKGSIVYSINLTNNSWLKVIQVPIVVEGTEDYTSRLRLSVAADPEPYLIDFVNRPIRKGVRIYTSVVTSAGETPYIKTDIPLFTRGVIKPITVHDETKTHQVIQEYGDGVSILEFNWNESKYGYIPTLKRLVRDRDIGNVTDISSNAIGTYYEQVKTKKVDDTYTVGGVDIYSTDTSDHAFNFIVANTDATGVPALNTSKWMILLEGSTTLAEYTDDLLERTYLKGKIVSTHVSSYDDGSNYNRKVTYVTNGNRIAVKYNDYMSEVEHIGSSTSMVITKVNTVVTERDIATYHESGHSGNFNESQSNPLITANVNLEYYPISSFETIGIKERTKVTMNEKGVYTKYTLLNGVSNINPAAVSNRYFPDYAKVDNQWVIVDNDYISLVNGKYQFNGYSGYIERELGFISSTVTNLEVVYISPRLEHLSKIERIVVTKETLTNGTVQSKLYEVTRATEANKSDPITAYRSFVLNDSVMPPTQPITPLVGMLLWESKVDDFISIGMFSANGKAFFMDGKDVNGDINWVWQSLIVPNDNGATMSAVPIFSNNITQYFIQQPNNGVFRYKYNKSGIENATITLELVASLLPQTLVLSGSRYKAPWANLPNPI